MVVNRVARGENNFISKPLIYRTKNQNIQEPPVNICAKVQQVKILKLSASISSKQRLILGGTTRSLNMLFWGVSCKKKTIDP